MRPPFESFSGPVCKGSEEFGTACGSCEKCVWEKAQTASPPTPPEITLAKSALTTPPNPSPRRPAIPIPKGGFKTNEEEAQWLADTIALRVDEILVTAGLRANVVPKGLRELFLLSLDAATARGRKQTAGADSST